MSDATPREPPPTHWTFGPVLIFLGIGAVTLAFRLNHPGLGDNQDPGPSAFPLFLGLCLAAGGIWELGHSLKVGRSRRPANDQGTARPTLSPPGPALTAFPPNVIILLAALTGYLVALPWLGFTLSTILFAAGMMLRLGAGWKWSVPMALLIVTAVHVLFVRGFKIQLPTGVWGWPW